MKTQKHIIISLAVVSIILTSCTSMLYTSLDVLRPAKVAFAPEASNLLIVNNTVTQPADQGHRTLLINAEPKNVVMEADSVAIFTIGALTEEIETKDFFLSVRLIPNSINPSTDFAGIQYLSREKVKELCLDNHSNTILALNKVKVNDDLSEYYLADAGSYLGTLEFRIETSWSIHYLSREEITTVQFKDTVYWESESYARRRALSDLPNRRDAMIDAALYAGHKSIDRFVPYWEKVDRYFFNPRNKLMRQGMDSVYVKNWPSAIQIWEKAMNKSSSGWIKAQAANNIAIAYEIMGNIDKALEYATQSYYSIGKQTFADYESFVRLSQYINELNQRKKELSALKKQLNE